MGYEEKNNDTINTAIEPIPIQDTYITGVDKVEFLGSSNVRIHLYAEENGQRVIVDKIVMAIENVPAGIAAIMKAMGNRAMRMPWIDEIAVADRVGRH